MDRIIAIRIVAPCPSYQMNLAILVQSYAAQVNVAAVSMLIRVATMCRASQLMIIIVTSRFCLIIACLIKGGGLCVGFD